MNPCNAYILPCLAAMYDVTDASSFYSNIGPCRENLVAIEALIKSKSIVPLPLLSKETATARNEFHLCIGTFSPTSQPPNYPR